MFRHGIPERRHHLTAENNIIPDGRIPEVQITIFQPLRFIGLPAAVDLEGKFPMTAAAQDFYFRGYNFNLACGNFRVLAGTLPDNAVNRYGGFLRNRLERPYHLFRFRYNLRNAVEIPDDYKRKL